MADPVISITAEDIPIFWKAVEISVGQAAGDPLRFCASFFESALALTRGKMKRMTSKDHDLDYRDVSVEYLMWAVGILSTTWTIETWRRKTRDGIARRIGTRILKRSRAQVQPNSMGRFTQTARRLSNSSSDTSKQEISGRPIHL